MTKYEARGQGELGNPQVPNSPHKCTAATHLELMVPAHVWALQLALHVAQGAGRVANGAQIQWVSGVCKSVRKFKGYQECANGLG